MALSTTQYGYIIDPMVPFTDEKGKTIKNGFVRVFVAGSSTPVVTYRNFDGATNTDRIELDNSGRTMTNVIGSKGLTYKVCVYDQHHSQESPILTVDKVSVIGANITAGTGATVVTGLDGLTTKTDGFVDASVVGTDGYVALDHTLVTDDLDTDAKATAVEDDRYIPLLNEDVNNPDSKMTLGRLWQWVLGKIKSISTTITAFRTGDVIPVDGPSGTAKMSKDDLLRVTAENALDVATIPIDKSIKSVEILQNLSYSLATTDIGYPIVSGGKITGYGTQGYWKHGIIDREEGLFVGFDTTTGTNDYIWYIDDNGVILDKYTIESPSVSIVRKVPLNFPNGSTKAVVISGNLGGQSYGMQIYLWKYVGIEAERKITNEELRKLPMNETRLTTTNGYPTFNSVGYNTGYGTESYWKHVEISAGYGKFVSFNVTGATNYLFYLDADGIVVKKESFSLNSGYIDKYPLDFPPEATKVIVMSSNNPDGLGVVILNELCDLEEVNAKIDESTNDIEIVQNLTYSEATSADGFPTISGGKITGYGAQTWWKHAIINKDKGLFVDFDTTTGTNDYIWYIDDNGVILDKYSIPSPSAAIVRKIPLNFPVVSTKAVVVSGNLGGASYGMKIHVWKYVGASEERKFTLDSLKMLPMKATPQVVADGFPTFDTFGGHTGYGTETYWKHAEISAGKGKFVSFYNSNSSTYVHYLDSDGVRIASEALAGSLGFIDKHPLNFPINSAKAIVMSANFPSGRGEVVLHELCDVDKVNDGVYATIDSLNPDLEPVDVQNDDGYVNRSNGYVTDFGTQTWWKHVTITRQEGLFVNFNINSSDVPVITYVDDSKKIIKEELFTGNNTKAFVNVPLNFPEASTKCYVQSVYGANMYQEVKVFKARKAYLPGYWNEAIESYAKAIDEETRKVANGCAFIFITDLHFGQYNENHAGRIINKLLEKTSVPFAISGGDYIYAVGDDVDEFEKELMLTRKFIGDVGKGQLFQVRGNHDFSMHYGTTDSPTGAILAKAGTNDYILSNLPSDVVIDKAHTCYYYDHKYSDTRFIFVNSCDNYVASDDYDNITEIGYNITDAQLSFIANAVKGADGKHVIVISHITADSANSGYSSSQLSIHNLLVAAKNHTTFTSGSVSEDFTNWTGTIVMQISGHAHTDSSASTDGILSVVTSCDARLGSNRVLGTILEQCFDVFIADYDNESVKSIRIGAGSDRTFTY